MRTCTACGTAGHDDTASFCFGCGSSLAATGCVSCGGALPPAALFCPTCGTPSGAPAPAAVLATERPPGSARKITSVLFGDLVGFTTLSESRDPEEVRELLTAYFDECRAVVNRYGGELEKFIGDAVMAVWGLPLTREDDAERAVRAGIELVERVAALGDRIDVPGLAMRVGITTAEVAVSLGATGQGMVAGDAVNTAARIQSTAPPGEVWVDETTRTFTTAVIAYEDAGSHAMKGKAEPVPLWAVRAVVAGAGGDRRDNGLEAQLVGRERELRLVKEVFHRVQETLRPGLLVVDGEPGIGKSRLGWEFEKYVDGFEADVLWHRGRCLSYGEGVAYYALAEAVRARLTILAAGEPDLDSREVLHRGLAACVQDPAERDWLEPRLAALLGLDSASFQREDLFVAWTAFFEHAGLKDAGPGAPEPVVLVVDDAQYADEGLLAFLEHLLTAADYPVFVLVLARPELLRDHPELVGNRRVTVVHLEPLSAADMARLLDDLVVGASDTLRDGLVARAEGIPLYALETVRTLVDQDLVVERDGRYLVADPDSVDLTVLAAPTTLQALIAARLDTLPADERRVVDRASVLGLVFTAEGIAALCTDVPDLEKALAGLFRREVLRRENDRLSGDFGSYRFVQGAVRQAAYGVLSRRDRKAAHLVAARSLGAELESRSDAYELAPIIAQHLMDAIDAVPRDADVPDLTRAASDHLELAAERASSLGAPREAAAHLAKALERCEPERRLTVQTRLVRQLRKASDHAQAIEHATEALKGHQEAGDVIGAAEVTEDLAMALVYGDYDLTRAENAVREQLELLPAIPDDPAALDARFGLVGAMASLLIRTGDEQRLAGIAQESLVLAELTGDARRIADSWTIQALSCTNTLPRLASLLLEQAATLAGEDRALRERTVALLNLTGLEAFDDLPRAVHHGREAIEAGRELGEEYVVAFARSNLAQALFLVGEWDEAEALAADEDVKVHLGVTADFFLRFLALARGEQHPPFDEAVGQDSDQVEDRGTYAEYVALSRALESHASGRPDAVQSAEESVRLTRAAAATNADFWPIWLVASEVVRERGDRAALARLLAYVDGSASPWPVGIRAQRARLRAFVGEDGSLSTDAVEASYREALTLVRPWGSVLHEAHTCADLGSWLQRQGRTEEGVDLVGRARATYQRLGARHWLAAFDAPA